MIPGRRIFFIHAQRSRFLDYILLLSWKWTHPAELQSSRTRGSSCEIFHARDLAGILSSYRCGRLQSHCLIFTIVVRYSFVHFFNGQFLGVWAAVIFGRSNEAPFWSITSPEAIFTSDRWIYWDFPSHYFRWSCLQTSCFKRAQLFSCKWWISRASWARVPLSFRTF